MKSLLLALTLLTLPLAAPVGASPADAALATPLRPLASAGTLVERRSHHCNTAAQAGSARCRGV